MPGSVRIAAVGDLHCTRASTGAFQTLFARVAESADVFAMCGDLTDRGQAEEARVLAKELQALKIPKIAVLGNHDFESDAATEVTEILTGAGVSILDGTALEVAGIGIAGAKGFAGGFGERALQAWGEEPIKTFVRDRGRRDAEARVGAGEAAHGADAWCSCTTRPCATRRRRAARDLPVSRVEPARGAAQSLRGERRVPRPRPPRPARGQDLRRRAGVQRGPAAAAAPVP